MADRQQNSGQDRPVSTMLSISEVARIFKVHVNTIRRWSDQGIVKSYRIGPRGDRKFRRENVAILYLDKAIQKYLKG